MISLKNQDLKQLITVTLLIFIAVLTRLVPHPPNFTPVLAIALLSGHTLSKSNKTIAYLIPLAIIIISDIFIGFHSTIYYVYGSIIAITFIGKFTNVFKSIKSAISTSIISSLLFFFVTNTAVFIHSTMYTKTLAGLWSCYIMAIPFFHNTLLSTLCYIGVFKVILHLNILEKVSNTVAIKIPSSKSNK